jgi:hypothetical protein
MLLFNALCHCVSNINRVAVFHYANGKENELILNEVSSYRL